MKKIIIAALICLAVAGVIIFTNINKSFGLAQTALTSSDTQNTERSVVNDLRVLANSFSTTTNNTFTGTNTFSGTLTCSGTCTGFSTLWPFTIGTYAGQNTSATSTLLHLTGSPLSLAASTTFTTQASTTLLTNTGTSYLSNLTITNSSTSTFSGGLYASQIAAPYFIATSTTATSTARSGWNLTGGCFAIAGNCLSLSTLTGTVPVTNGGSGATSLTGLLQGNGTSAFTAVSDSSTVGQILRVTGSATYAWGALNLADTDAVTGALPATNGGTGATSLGTAFTVSSNVFSFLDDPGLSYATSTTWTGTTTRLVKLPIVALTITSLRCKTVPSAATVNVQIGKWTASTTMVAASSTANIFTFGSTLAVANTELVAVTFGGPTGSPTEVVCSVGFIK